MEVPSTRKLSRLTRETTDELDTAGSRALLRRAVSAQLALSETILRFLVATPEDRGLAQVARVMRELFERLGATYVKMGQLIASSPTVFPAEVVAEFENCLDAAPPVEIVQIRRVVERSLGRRLEEAFASFDVVPLATASVAQVHSARLRDGREVVVKVRKPGVEETLKCDLAVVTVAAKWIEAVAPEMRRIDLAGLAKELRDSIAGELDFEQEATRLREFRGFLQQNGLDNVATVPDPIPEFSTDVVLTMTKLDGEPLAEASKLSFAETAVANLVRVWALSVTNGPFFHADLHAGNVLLLRDGKTLGLLDFGVVGVLPAETYAAVLRMADAYRDQNVTGIVAALREMGVATKTLDLDKLANDLGAVLFTKQKSSDVNNVVQIIDISERNNLRLPRQFSLLVKQAMYLDRYISALAPDMDVFSDPRVALGAYAAPATFSAEALPSNTSTLPTYGTPASSSIGVLPSNASKLST